MRLEMRYILPLTLVLLLVCALIPWLNDYVLYVATIAVIWAALAVSFDVLLGYTGYLSLAHGVLYGLGAYGFGIMTARLEWSFWVALPICGLLAGVIGAVIALLAFRTKGLYFAVLTLGIGLVGFQMFLVMEEWTGGMGGFVGIPSPPSLPWLDLAPAQNNLVLAIIMLWITFLAARAFVRSSLGAACLAIREDEILARALGIRVAIARLAAFTFSATFTGMIGALFASISNFVAPESFAVMTTGFHLVVLTVVGGMGTLWGPILGAIVLTLMPETLRIASSYSLAVYGVVLLGFMLFAPKGLSSLIERLWRWFRKNNRDLVAADKPNCVEGVQ